jgi:hypothetical protein
VVRTIDRNGLLSTGRGDRLLKFYDNFGNLYPYDGDLTTASEIGTYGGRFSSALEFALLGVDTSPKGFK